MSPLETTSAHVTLSHILREVIFLRRERDLTKRETELLRREVALLRTIPRIKANTLRRIAVKK